MSITAQLFITCLHEHFCVEALKGMVTVLERTGVRCAFPEAQTCCGQPFFNTGFHSQAREVAWQWLQVFGATEGYIVSPSGSCVDMVRHRYPTLFAPGTPEHGLAAAVAERTFEFSQFLVRVLGVTDVGARFPHRVTYHASCHLLRGLGARHEPRRLLEQVRDLELVPLPEEETCCGFGGAFSIINPEVSGAMTAAKARGIQRTGAEVVVAGDAGCLLTIAGSLRQAGATARVMHLAEVLAAR